MCDLIRWKTELGGQRASLHGAFPSFLIVIMALNSALSLQLVIRGSFPQECEMSVTFFWSRMTTCLGVCLNLLVGTYEEASSFTFSCFLQVIQLSGFVFSYLIWVEIFKEKGQKENPSWWMDTLRQLNFCFLRNICGLLSFPEDSEEENHLNLSEKFRE